eukprot:jgi/Chrzof1/11887/Cz06g13180.t1
METSHELAIRQLEASDYDKDPQTGRVVGAATVVIENKFVHACNKVGHIEDVVVDASARGHNLGKRLITHLMDIAKQRGCYKVILDCKDANVGFYEKCGLERRGVEMGKYFYK